MATTKLRIKRIKWEEHRDRRHRQYLQAERICKNIQKTKKLDDGFLRLASNIKSGSHEQDPVYQKIGEAWGHYSMNVLDKTPLSPERTEAYHRMSDWHARTSDLLMYRQMGEVEYNHILNSPVERIVEEVIRDRLKAA